VTWKQLWERRESHTASGYVPSGSTKYGEFRDYISNY